ncbi:MAG: hypothetical protein K2H64_12840 [Desulfovibrio sp.]|nr:hypothetical protein [Desulfovibrio sp.]
MDKGGAVYDAYLMARDAEEGWATARNGKKFHYTDGQIDAGNVGQKKSGEPYQSREVETTAPDTARYQELLVECDGDHRKAAHKYFREKLQGRHVEAMTPDGPINATFTGRSWQELKRGMKNDPVKTELIPYLPEIISSGTYGEEIPAHDHPDVKCFHTFTKVIETSQGKKECIVDVAEKNNPDANQPKHLVYNLTREGTKNYEDRKRESSASDSGSSLRPAKDSLDKSNISPLYEVVNLRFADEEANW